MIDDADTPGTRGWWFKTLAAGLRSRREGRSGTRVWSRSSTRPNRARPGIDLLDDYRNGEPPLNTVASEWQPHVREFMRMGRLHTAELIVSSTSSRMELRDFRTAAADDELGDRLARDIMRANDLEVRAPEIHDDMLGDGDAYAIVQPPRDGGLYPLITAESPQQVITAHDPATGATLAGLKLFRDEWDTEDVAYLYLPGRVFIARKRGAASLGSGPFRMSRSWAWDDLEQDVPGGVVPVVRFRNRQGVGEYERHLGTLDRINELIALEWWIAKIQAHRQRAVKGLPDANESGEEYPEGFWSDMFVADPAAMWKVPPDVEFWESQPTDLTPVTNAIKHNLERLAAVTATPLHTITPDAAAGSAEGASLMREEHVYKIENRRAHATVGHRAVMAMAFLFMRDTARSDRAFIEPLWGPVERHSLGEKANAAAQAGKSLPVEAIQTDIWQYPPAEVQNLRVLRGRDLLFGEAEPAPAAPPTAL